MNFIKLNKTTIHYKYLPCSPLGDGGKTFLFINSLGTDFRIWDEVAGTLKDYGNILLYDKRGHGLSDAVTTTNGLNDFAADAAALINHLGIQKCIPVGLSVGGMIAQLLAHRNLAKIEKLVLCDTRHKIGNAQIWNDRITAVKEKGLASISDAVMQRWFSGKFRKEEAIKVAGYKNMLERTPALGYIKTCEAIRDADLTEIAKQIKIPTLCVAGSEDKSTTPEEVKNLADLIEGARYEVIEGSGHIPCVDNPAALSNLIIDFIK
jgi:3-oxoadipate enol-lactonase